jgi:hypothetical protein
MTTTSISAILQQNGAVKAVEGCETFDCIRHFSCPPLLHSKCLYLCEIHGIDDVVGASDQTRPTRQSPAAAGAVPKLLGPSLVVLQSASKVVSKN